MTFPKKNTRTLTVQREKYFWHLNEDWDVTDSWIIIRHAEHLGQLLFLSPYYINSIPGSIAGAIKYALKNGWEPKQKASPMYLNCVLNSENDVFVILKSRNPHGKM